MNYKIGKIMIENFKHIDYLLLDFKDKDLVILDGPNGFGKTTIFDVIELVLRKEIDRVTNINDGRRGYNKLLLVKDEAKNTTLKVEFYNEKDKFTIVQQIDAGIKINSPQKKPDNWEVFRTYYLNDFEDDLVKENYKKEEDLPDIKKIYRYFSLFYYVQQEENTAFFKKNTKERMSIISALFDTEKEEREKQKLTDVRQKIITKEKTIKTAKDLKTTALEQVIKNISEEELEKHKEVEYFILFQNAIIQPEWDKKISTIQIETKDSYLQELRIVYQFKKNFKEFLKAKSNKIIEKYAINNQLLKHTIISSHFINEFDILEQLIKKENNLSILRKKISRDKLSQSIDRFPFKAIYSEIELEIDKEKLNQKVESLMKHKKEMSDLSNIVQELNDIRENLIIHFNKFITFIDKEKENCPLCGNSQDSHEELIKSIELKRLNFVNYYDNSSDKFETILNELYIEILNPVIEWIDKYLSDPINIVNREFFEQLKDSHKYKQDIIKFNEWLKNQEITLETFVTNEKSFVLQETIDSKILEFSKMIRKKKKNVKNEYAENSENFKKFEIIYSDLFSENERMVEEISLEKIIEKANYISYQYFNNSTMLAKKLKAEVEILNHKCKTIDSIKVNLNDIIKVYDRKISEHWKKIIQNIEIPFYVYSGKIIQDYQNGRGIFIKENNNSSDKSISFVSNSKSDHDVVNYLSSGQLSALIISFTLALNKIYGNKTMDILLIDDPIQTMDEINMASFVEVLRNDFRKKQIILSTHEENISRYMRYKFKKYNLKTYGLNIKDKLYPNLNFNVEKENK